MPASVEEAFAHCEARVKAHYENFPVGLFVPREKRRYVYALYAFARRLGRAPDDAQDLVDETMEQAEDLSTEELEQKAKDELGLNN